MIKIFDIIARTFYFSPNNDNFTAGGVGADEEPPAALVAERRLLREFSII
jgi:hypothetical protein